MAFKAFLLVCAITCVSGMERGDFEKYGPFRNVLNSAIIKCVHNRNLNLDVSDIKVHFFDFANDVHESFLINDAPKGILNTKGLNKNKKFVMFVGGFTSHINHSIEVQMRAAYATYPNSYLIIPDHSRYTNTTITTNIRSYERSVTYVHYIGKALGEMWAKIHQGGVRTKNMYFVGHSLGGQILGHTGESFFNNTGKKIKRISALDPAGPCFANSHIQDQVRSGLAKYVEVYHCNSGSLGSSNNLGDVDYILNKNGESQPSCRTPYIPKLYDSSVAATCNHRACIDVWTATVRSKELFPAYSCDSYDSFKQGLCAANKTIAGAHSPGTAKGVYYMSTEHYNLEEIRSAAAGGLSNWWCTLLAQQVILLISTLF